MAAVDLIGKPLLSDPSSAGRDHRVHERELVDNYRCGLGMDHPIPMRLAIIVPKEQLKARDVFTFLCCWHLWKHRNGVVFNEQQPCLSNILRSCREDARLWASRLPRADAPVVESWCNLLSPV
ncbi:hypothetical protein SETIT_9G323400v2 [Setaria italica]|uniref:Uncharacterized protein n=1 Tax=Setaria italica TaxID=4555 RepID=A0A368SMZ1_SETIT|nr:hypothetical protein SETIT_9G323400v2 [Setaria italica]